MRPSLSLFLSRLNKPKYLSQSFYIFPSRPFTIFVDLLWTLSDSFITFYIVEPKTDIYLQYWKRSAELSEPCLIRKELFELFFPKKYLILWCDTKHNSVCLLFFYFNAWPSLGEGEEERKNNWGNSTFFLWSYTRLWKWLTNVTYLIIWNKNGHLANENKVAFSHAETHSLLNILLLRKEYRI